MFSSFGLVELLLILIIVLIISGQARSLNWARGLQSHQRLQVVGARSRGGSSAA
jgi:Sec-independent protein translocase protein TatA